MHLRGCDFDDKHFGEELDGGAEQMTGVAGGAVFFEANRHVDVRSHLLVDWVVGERAGAESFDVGEVDLAPDWRVGIVEPVAGADEMGLTESCDEAGNVALGYILLVAELAQCGEKVLAVVESDGEAATKGELCVTHAWRS